MFNHQDKMGICALFMASANGRTEVGDLLLRRGCDVNTATLRGWTSLHVASFNCHKGVVRLLLAAGASVTAEDDQGRSAMDFATEERHAGVRQILQLYIAATAPPSSPAAAEPAQPAAASSDVAAAGPSAHEQETEGSTPGAAGDVAEKDGGGAGGRRGGKRAFRFRCNSPACANTEESLQRLLNKCGRCRGVRYCSDACRLVDWRSHKLVCRAPSLAGGEGTATAPALPVGPAATAVSVERGGAEGGGAGAQRCGFPDCPHGDVSARDQCGACGQARYCSRPCQLQHWPQHRPECQAARGAGVGAPLGP